MNIALINEVGLTDADMKTILLALDSHAKKVETAYGLPRTEISTTKLTNIVSSIILLTERLPKGMSSGSALAYRVVENGVPTVYASYRKSGKLFGRYTKPFVLRGRTINPARLANGYLTVLCHELSELLVAPMLDQFTLPDNAGKSWRKEVCDPVLGSYFYELVNGQDCVFPDFVLPSFWDVNGKAPFSYLGTAKAPLTWAHPSYAWFRTKVGGLLTRVTF